MIKKRIFIFLISLLFANSALADTSPKTTLENLLH